MSIHTILLLSPQIQIHVPDAQSANLLGTVFEAEKALLSEKQSNEEAGNFSWICLAWLSWRTGYILLAKECGG